MNDAKGFTAAWAARHVMGWNQFQGGWFLGGICYRSMVEDFAPEYDPGDADAMLEAWCAKGPERFYGHKRRPDVEVDANHKRHAIMLHRTGALFTIAKGDTRCAAACAAIWAAEGGCNE